LAKVNKGGELCFRDEKGPKTHKLQVSIPQRPYYPKGMLCPTHVVVIHTQKHITYGYEFHRASELVSRASRKALFSRTRAAKQERPRRKTKNTQPEQVKRANMRHQGAAKTSAKRARPHHGQEQPSRDAIKQLLGNQKQLENQKKQLPNDHRFLMWEKGHPNRLLLFKNPLL
jgi:hypothetical protein